MKKWMGKLGTKAIRYGRAIYYESKQKRFPLQRERIKRRCWITWKQRKYAWVCRSTLAAIRRQRLNGLCYAIFRAFRVFRGQCV